MRVASITFDDGLWETAKLAVTTGQVLRQRYSFYPVAEWVNGQTPTDHYNLGLSHGDVEGWKMVAAAGHEVGSHTMTHCRSGTPGFRDGCSRSLEWLRQFGPAPYTFAFPYDVLGPKPDGFIVARGGEQWGYEPYIDLTKPIPDVVHSINPVWSGEPIPFDGVFEIIKNIPADHWLIINLHGVEEGWGPLTKQDFFSLTHYLSACGILVRPVREIANAFRTGGHDLQQNPLL